MDAMVERAILLATHAHLGQVDKIGEPYILHPLRVMLAVPPYADLRALGVLHDVIEDTSLTPNDLLHEGFEQDFIDTLLALTRREGEPYLQFVGRACEDPRAKIVKLHDVQDNMKPERMGRLGESDKRRMYAKYDEALRLLRY